MSKARKQPSPPPHQNDDWIQTLFKYTRDGYILIDENRQTSSMIIVRDIILSPLMLEIATLKNLMIKMIKMIERRIFIHE